MSVTSKLAFARSTSGQSISNAYGPIAGPALGSMSGAPPSSGFAGGQIGAPTTLSQVSGNQQQELAPANFVQIMLGVVITIGLWWLITWILEKLLPHHETPHFLEDFLHGLRVALIVGVWFILMKMTTGVAPFKFFPSYRTVVQGF